MKPQLCFLKPVIDVHDCSAFHLRSLDNLLIAYKYKLINKKQSQM